MGILDNGSHTINGGTNSSSGGGGSSSGPKCFGKRLGKFKTICAVLTLVFGVGSIVCGILVVFFFRDAVDSIIKSELPLRQGSQIAKVWAKPPITPYLKLYFFNVTNHEEFLNGSKPVLEEIGPFTYSESWEKANVTWLDGGNKVEFGQKKTYHFQPDLSTAGEDTKLILPNLPMLSALASVVHLPESEKIIRVALGSMLELLKQESFAELTVREILWGYENKLIQLSRSIFPEGEGYPFDEFGLFKGKNGTVSAFMQTWTGQSNILDVGKVHSWDDETELSFWKNDTGSMCNAIQGTDGSTFHPDIKKDETIHIFNRDLCRSLPLVYQKDVIDGNGIPGYRFIPPNNVFAPPEENPDNECFCLNHEGCNVPRGLFNMSACQFGSPTMMSWPHFLDADPKLLEAVEGLKPDPEKHQFYIDLQPKLGTSLRAQARSQINIQMHKVEDVKPAEGLRDIVFPFVWFSDGIETIDDATTVALLHSAVHTPEKARSALYPAFFVIGAVCILLVVSCVGYNHFGQQVRSEAITPRRTSKMAEENGNSNNGTTGSVEGHYEMKSNGVLASS